MRIKHKVIAVFTLPFILIIISAAFSDNQYGKVSGEVIDAETGKPLFYVNVFLAYTTGGCATDRDGRFVIENIPPGMYTLIAHHIGYEHQTTQIRITESESLVFNFKLKPTVLKGERIQVTAEYPKEWRKKLKKFEKLFLSTTKNASKTKILNPYVLDFPDVKLGAFTAIAQEPLIIENLALGYKLHYLLEFFESTSSVIKFNGYARFEELDPESPKQKARWEKNRRRTYYGSFRHFLTSICENYQLTKGSIMEREYNLITDDQYNVIKIKYENKLHLEKQGFYILSVGAKNVFPKNMNGYISPASFPNERILKFPTKLEVIYDRELQDYNYLKFSLLTSLPSVQRSWITLEKDSAFIDYHGRYWDTYSLKTSGYWGWERVAEMLPYDYFPSDEEKEL